tara:strand:+ start:384 stop:641 length:258 start_codon:yes stop_codon:yes gene_type:complete
MKVDLHGLPLSEAKLRAQISVGEAWADSLPKIELVHGHNLGTAIKNYIQNSAGLCNDMKRIYPEIPPLILKDKGLGSTIIRFKRP